jgi:hypothetical protein
MGSKRLSISAMTFALACSGTEFNGGGGRTPPLDQRGDESVGHSAPNDGSANGQSEGNDRGNADQSQRASGTERVKNDADESVASISFKLLEPSLKNVPLDVTLFVDNSGSMFNEAKIVRDNIERFIDSVSSRTDLKLILVSLESKESMINGATENAGVKLPDMFKAAGNVQISIEPGDRSLLATAAAAVCPANTSPLGFIGPNGSPVGLFEKVDSCTTQICGQSVMVPKCNRSDFLTGPVMPKTNDGYPWPIIWLDTDPISRLAGKVNEQLRVDSKRVFIFITDDDSTVVDETNFLGLVRPFSGRRAPRVFAFTGIPGVTNGKPEEGCYLANYGRSYVKLADVTGGNVFDICMPDWTNNFDSLATALTEESATETLYAINSPRPLKRIISLTYDDGKIIDPTKYGLVTGNYLRLDLDVVKALSGREVKLRFEQ